VLHFAYVRNKVSTTLVANPTSEHGFAVVRDAVPRRLTPLQLEELLGRGARGTTWRARLADGTRVAVKRMDTVAEDLTAFFHRLERASEVHHVNLLEVVRALEENREVWVVSRLGTGVPLSTLLKAGRMRSGCAVAVGMGILSGLTALHQAGLWHGAMHGRNVHVDLDGTVRLGDHCLSPAPAGQSSAALRAADVRAAGALICTMLRVPLESGPPTGQKQTLKVASSPLGLAAKAIAGPPRKLPAGYEAAHASLTLWEAARRMATSRRQAQARHDLADMVTTALGTPRPTVVQRPGRPERQDQGGEPGIGVPGVGPAGVGAQGTGPAGAALAPPVPSGPPAAPELPAPQEHPAREVARLPVDASALPSAALPAPARGPTAGGNRPAGAVGASAAPPLRTRLAGPSIASRRVSAIRVPWSLLALLAAALLLGVCLLIALASAMPAYWRSPARAGPAPTQEAPAPTSQVSQPAPTAALPAYGEVPVTTPIVMVPERPGTAPSQASPAPPQPVVAPGTGGVLPPAPGAASGAPSAGSTAPLSALSALPPASAGDVLSVSLDSSGCAPNIACTITVQVALQPAGHRRTVDWTLSSVDLCTGRAVQLSTISVVAQPGWNHVIGMSTVTIPSASAQVLLAVTDSPARAASSLVAAGSNHCP
jgi:hypothetical protein